MSRRRQWRDSRSRPAPMRRGRPGTITIREAKAAARRRRWLERLGILVELAYLLRRVPAAIGVAVLVVFMAAGIYAFALAAYIVARVGWPVLLAIAGAYVAWRILRPIYWQMVERRRARDEIPF